MKETVYNRISLFRTERKISRKQLAQELGVNFQTIGYIERGDFKPSLELALKLAKYFNVSVEVLFSLEPFESIAQLTQNSRTGEKT